MTIRRIWSFLILAAVLALPLPLWDPAPGVAAAKHPFELSDVVARSVANITPVQGRINVAVTSAFEARPQAAICASNQYLVVYEYAGETGPDSIYGQRLTSTGALLGPPFEIDLHPQDQSATHPDVACEWSNDRFVVTWAYDYYGNSTDLDVYARAVYGSHQTSGPQLASGLVPVSAGVDYESNPAIACNSDDASCLVVFGYSTASDSEIYGQRLVVTAPGIGFDGDRFNISQDSAVDMLPDVAWGPLDENYLVAWSHYYGGNYRILHSLIHDTEQGTGMNELQTNPSYLIGPTAPGWTSDQSVPAVAFNRKGSTSGRYLVIFKNSNTEIGARRVKGSDGLAEGDPFLVTQTMSSGRLPTVAASSGPGEVAGGAGADQFLVTFPVDNEPVQAGLLYGQAVKGTHIPAGSQLDGSAFEIARTVHGTEDSEVKQGGVTGSAHNGRYAVVWQDRDGAGIDDVYGQLLAPYAVYVPLIVSRR